MNTHFTETFNAQRQHLLGLSYRITGSLSDAEDIVHETFLKWLHADHAAIQSPRAWLTKVASRLALDHLKSARVQRESYMGPWLPEPYVEERDTPDEQFELDESISIALMVVLERMSPGERAAFILHDVFHFSFKEIGDIIEKPSATCRKLAERARNKVRNEAPDRPPKKEEYLGVANAFFEAVKQGNVQTLVNLLQTNVIFHTDSDGKAPAALEILEDQSLVIDLLLDKVRPVLNQSGPLQAMIQCIWFNGVPGFVLIEDNQPVSAFNFVIRNRQIDKIYVHRNPEKLDIFKRPAET